MGEGAWGPGISRKGALMKRLIALLSVIAVAGFPGYAGAATGKDSARGRGIDFLDDSFSFNAESDPAGGSPKGTMTYETASFKVTAEVTCLVVETSAFGPVAGISGDIIKATGTVPGGGDGLFFEVADWDESDFESDFFLATVEPESRPERTCPAAFVNNTEGEIEVIDE
jgi:hypothetical protein